MNPMNQRVSTGGGRSRRKMTSSWLQGSGCCQWCGCTSPSPPVCFGCANVVSSSARHRRAGLGRHSCSPGLCLPRQREPPHRSLQLSVTHDPVRFADAGHLDRRLHLAAREPEQGRHVANQARREGSNRNGLDRRRSTLLRQKAGRLRSTTSGTITPVRVSYLVSRTSLVAVILALMFMLNEMRPPMS